MTLLETKHFGKLSYETDSELDFPVGLPGFDDSKRFVAVHIVENDPLIYLQSLEDPALCFITMPVLAIDPHYRLNVSGGDLGRLGLNSARQPRIGDDVMCLSVLSITETGPTANLLAPILVNLRNRKAVQSVAPGSDYSHQFALMPQEALPLEAMPQAPQEAPPLEALPQAPQEAMPLEALPQAPQEAPQPQAPPQKAAVC